MHIITPIAVFLLLIFSSCSSWQSNQENRANNIARPSPTDIAYVKYFRSRKIMPNNDYSYLKNTFEGEAQGEENEIIYYLNHIESTGREVYKVFYNYKNQIIRHKFFEKGVFQSSAIYYYERSSSRAPDKLIKIEYYNKDGSIIAFDKIEYNEFGRPFRTKRFNTEGKGVVNLF